MRRDLLQYAKECNCSLEEYQELIDENKSIINKIDLQKKQIEKIEKDCAKKIAEAKAGLYDIRKLCKHIDITKDGAGDYYKVVCNTCGKVLINRNGPTEYNG